MYITGHRRTNPIDFGEYRMNSFFTPFFTPETIYSSKLAKNLNRTFYTPRLKIGNQSEERDLFQLDMCIFHLFFVFLMNKNCHEV